MFLFKSRTDILKGKHPLLWDFSLRNVAAIKMKVFSSEGFVSNKNKSTLNLGSKDKMKYLQ